MSQEDETAAELSGLPVEEAVSVVVDRDGTRDPDRVREALGYVVEDGVVTEAAVEPALAHLSKVVSTPETRAELAAIELDDAREAAAPVDDLPVVRARLEAFESRLETVTDEVAVLGPALQSLLDEDAPDDLYALAAEIRALTDRANRLQHAADELQVDVEGFRGWLDDPDERFDALSEEVDALESSLDALEEATESLSSSASGDDPAATWAEVRLRHRAISPLLADLRAELDDLRTWADREDHDAADRATAVETRLDDLAARWRATDDRLEALGTAAWADRYGDHLAAFDAAVADVEPPVDWSVVQEELEAYLDELDER